MIFFSAPLHRSGSREILVASGFMEVDVSGGSIIVQKVDLLMIFFCDWQMCILLHVISYHQITVVFGKVCICQMYC